MSGVRCSFIYNSSSRVNEVVDLPLVNIKSESNICFAIEEIINNIFNRQKINLSNHK